MTFLRILRWEVAEYRRNRFVALLTGSLALLAYVLSYVYGSHRVEYFARIVFAIVPIGFAFLAQPQAAATEQASARLLAVYPRAAASVFWGRVAGAAFAVSVYLLLVSPMVVWYGAHFPHRLNGLLLGMLAALLLGVSAYLIGRVALRVLARAPILSVALAVLLLFVGVSVAALVGYGGPGLDLVLDAIPAVSAGKVANAFVDMRVAPGFALATLLAGTLLVLAVARRLAAPTRRSGLWVGGAALLLVLCSAATAFATTEVPYSNMTKVSGAFSVTSPTLFQVMPIDADTRTVLLLRDPSNPVPGVRAVEVSGKDLRITVDASRVRDVGGHVEVPVTIHPLPVSSPRREVYTLHVEWTQGDGQIKAADQLIIGAYPDFGEGLRWSSLVVLLGFAPAFLRRRRNGIPVDDAASPA